MDQIIGAVKSVQSIIVIAYSPKDLFFSLLVERQSEQSFEIQRFPTSSTVSPGARLSSQPIEGHDVPQTLSTFDPLQRLFRLQIT